MSDRWYEIPPQTPYICFRTRTSDRKRGPFFEFEGWFVNGETMREERRYLSTEFVREMLRAPGSPFVDPWNELQKARKEVERLTVELEAARADHEVTMSREAVVKDVAEAVNMILEERKRADDRERMERARRAKQKVTDG